MKASQVLQEYVESGGAPPAYGVFAVDGRSCAMQVLANHLGLGTLMGVADGGVSPEESDARLEAVVAAFDLEREIPISPEEMPLVGQDIVKARLYILTVNDYYGEWEAIIDALQSHGL